MKQYIAVLITAFVLLSLKAGAQTPQKINYQAIVRSADNKLVSNTQIGMQIRILQGSATGTVVYEETLTAVTNANGLLTIEIGGQTGFDTITWANTPYFLETGIDPAGGTNYSVIKGTSRLLTVPYAFHAKTSEYVMHEADGDVTNEIQTLSLNGLNLSISGTGGNAVTLPDKTVLPFFSRSELDTLSPENGQLIYNKSDSMVLMWNGTHWIQLMDKCFPQPTPAEAGNTIYAPKQTTVKLHANKPVHGTGKWRVVSGQEGTFSDPIDPESEFTGEQKGIYILRWTIGTICDSSYDEVKVYLGNVIGNYGYGGVIFYVDEEGHHGLVCATTDQSAMALWGCDGQEISGADETAIGTGAENTEDIVAQCKTPGIAAEICASLSLNKYTDWFLPSKDELNEMYLHTNEINVTALNKGGNALAERGYWSSSEHALNRSRLAWYQDFSNGHQMDNVKSISAHVRAVRPF